MSKQTDRILALEAPLQEVVQSQQKATQSYAEVATKLEVSNKSNLNIQEQFSKQVKSLKNEIQTDSRAKNIILFGIDEVTSESDSLADSVNEILRQCNLTGSVDTEHCHRLGQKKPEKSRPVKVALKSESEKWEVLKRINSMKPRNVFGRLDLTKEEQEKDFRLRQELKKTRVQNPDNHYKIVKNKVVQVTG